MKRRSDSAGTDRPTSGARALKGENGKAGLPGRRRANALQPTAAHVWAQRILLNRSGCALPAYGTEIFFLRFSTRIVCMRGVGRATRVSGGPVHARRGVPCFNVPALMACVDFFRQGPKTDL